MTTQPDPQIPYLDPDKFTRLVGSFQCSCQKVQAARFGGCCDRCGKAFLTPDFPPPPLCRPCYLESLPPAERAAELVRGGWK